MSKSSQFLGAQVSLFEPTGLELSFLARQKAKSADAQRKLAELCAFRGFGASASVCLEGAAFADGEAAIAEMAFMFERLAGLVEVAA